MRRVEIVDRGLKFGGLDRRQATDMIVLHHTGNPQDDNCSAEQLHASHLAKGWAGVGYHYIVRKGGDIEQGRPHWTVGAHAEGHNWHTIGIHLCGNFEDAEPTAAQIESAALLTAHLCHDYGLPIDDEHVIGHCDLMATACPGAVLYALLQEIRGKAIWYQEH